MHYWRGKIFDRCFAGHRRAITFGLLGPQCSVMSPTSATRHLIDDLIDIHPNGP